MLPLPTPAKGGDINELREFVNLPQDDDWILFATYLVCAIFSDRPYPILGIHGEAGSAKTTMARIIRKLVDPNVAASRAAPRDGRDLMVMANNSWMLSYDNLSYLPSWLSDGLCRLSTGAGFSTRSLYTDSDEIIFDGKRPVVLNGIEELATRTDLLDRSVLFELPVIRKFLPEKEFSQKFDAVYPQLLGALLDVAVGVLQNETRVKSGGQLRMADFARLGIAAESALGSRRGDFERAYTRNRQNARMVALEASPIANLIMELAREDWQGSATELLQRLNSEADKETQSARGWPKSPKVISGMVKRLATVLRTGDIAVEFSRDDTPNRNKRIRIRPIKSEEKKTKSGFETLT